MMFAEKIKQLREERQIPQRVFAAALEIDTATYCKIEKGERQAKKEYIPIIATILIADEKELLTLWLADKVTAVVGNEKKISTKALDIVKNNLRE